MFLKESRRELVAQLQGYILKPRPCKAFPKVDQRRSPKSADPPSVPAPQQGVTANDNSSPSTRVRNANFLFRALAIMLLKRSSRTHHHISVFRHHRSGHGPLRAHRRAGIVRFYPRTVVMPRI
ncbi:hypothetical protein BDQ12DRAFT_693408 [Crucibulum laeve]|uniref:Uncharacterized protein n=1 Tax=Crucibulum laeve TaxID=68775 RepID=A0A5C3LJ39_9AGAR|nr:hypothetical protein BDQ12DRAFT_693408 [Crucibulum laeve]